MIKGRERRRTKTDPAVVVVATRPLVTWGCDFRLGRGCLWEVIGGSTKARVCEGRLGFGSFG